MQAARHNSLTILDVAHVDPLSARRPLLCQYIAVLTGFIESHVYEPWDPSPVG